MKKLLEKINKVINEKQLKEKFFKIKYVNGDYKIVQATDSLEVIKKYDLATKEHIDTRVIELSGEQAALAQAFANANESTVSKEYKGVTIGWDKDVGYFWGKREDGKPIPTDDKRKINIIRSTK